MMNSSLCPCVPAISIRHLSQPTVGSSQCGVHPAKDQQPVVNTTNMNSRYSGELYHILVESPCTSEFHVDQGARVWFHSHVVILSYMFTFYAMELHQGSTNFTNPLVIVTRQSCEHHLCRGGDTIAGKIGTLCKACTLVNNTTLHTCVCIYTNLQVVI